MMNFSIAKLLSKLKTNFLIPNLIAFTTPKPNVISEDFFSPLITKITLSESKSNAKPTSFVLLISSVNSSEVGSGPLEHLSNSSFIVVTWHPISFNNCGATSLAAPPPTTTVTCFSCSSFPITSTASEI